MAGPLLAPIRHISRNNQPLIKLIYDFYIIRTKQKSTLISSLDTNTDARTDNTHTHLRIFILHTQSRTPTNTLATVSNFTISLLIWGLSTTNEKHNKNRNLKFHVFWLSSAKHYRACHTLYLLAKFHFDQILQFDRWHSFLSVNVFSLLFLTCYGGLNILFPFISYACIFGYYLSIFYNLMIFHFC